MKKLWFIILACLLLGCSSLSLATKSSHAVTKRELTFNDIRFQLNRIYYRPITPSYINWMPARAGGLNSWILNGQLQNRWMNVYGLGNAQWSWNWFSPWNVDEWYWRGGFGWYPNPNQHINPNTGQLVNNNPQPRYQPIPQPQPKPRPLPRIRIPRDEDIYMAPPRQPRSNTAGNTLNQPRQRVKPPSPRIRVAPRVNPPRGSSPTRVISTSRRGKVDNLREQ